MRGPEPPTDTAALPRLREALAAADYTLDGISACLGDRATRALHREQPTPAELVTRHAGSPIATLVRLFALGHAVSSARLDAALPGLGTAWLVEQGIVHGTPEEVRASFDLRPYAAGEDLWWVLSDLSEVMTGAPLPADHVLGIGGASTTLASWTIRRSVGRALDLGTGCGVQSLHLSTHADGVVATDTSARALTLARANAALNEVVWDLRHGDLFEPVAGEEFDQVVSNPPFVITPRTGEVPTYEYRDGGRVGHEIVRSVVREVGSRLRPGGVAQLLGNWEVGAGGDWRQVVQEWLADSELDAWVVQREVQDVAEYAELWAGDGGHRQGTPGYEQMYAAWLADFDAREVEQVGFGVLTLQRPGHRREPWRDLVDCGGPLRGPMGPVIEAGLRARNWLAEHGDAGLLETAWRCAEDVTEERYGRPGADDPNVIMIRQGGGLGRSVRAGTVLAAFVSVCDGELPAGRALDAIAQLVGASPQAVRDEVLPDVRELVADGLLVD